MSTRDGVVKFKRRDSLVRQASEEREVSQKSTIHRNRDVICQEKKLHNIHIIHTNQYFRLFNLELRKMKTNAV